MHEEKSILIIITSGKEDKGKKAVLGFTLAISALRNHNDVTIFLTKNGTIWCSPDQAKSIYIRGIKTLDDYIHTFLRMQGKLFVSSKESESDADAEFEYSEEASKEKVVPFFEKAEFKGSAIIKRIAQESSVVSL